MLPAPLDGEIPTTFVRGRGVPDDFPFPEQEPRSDDDQTPHHVGIGGWDGYMPPEDHAMPPRLIWTEDQREMLLSAHREAWRQCLDPDEEGEFDIVWPPHGYLITEGAIWMRQVCAEHDRDECTNCEWTKSVPDEVAPARCVWSVQIDTLRRGIVESSENIAVMEVLMDPRDVAYDR